MVFQTVPEGKLTSDKFLEQNELDNILKYAYEQNVRYASLCEWLYLTGMRVGEATALNYHDICRDDEGTWHASITSTLDYNHMIDDQKKAKTAKTASSVRDVILVEIYQRWYEAQLDAKFLFRTTHRTPIQSSALNTFLRTAANKLGIIKKVSSHIFRHTHISKLAELGMPLYLIQERVGHKDSRITKQIYPHVTHEALVKNQYKLESL
ncbi:MAG TPA: site-specific integrase [Candidatus Limosilactobacillus faecipullorum]|nr:site-specific integrase [Candidatus Limosilactobacillus faecipullorum]